MRKSRVIDFEVVLEKSAIVGWLTAVKKICWNVKRAVSYRIIGASLETIFELKRNPGIEKGLIPGFFSKTSGDIPSGVRREDLKDNTWYTLARVPLSVVNRFAPERKR